jgi:hypothetical protein
MDKCFQITIYVLCAALEGENSYLLLVSQMSILRGLSSANSDEVFKIVRCVESEHKPPGSSLHFLSSHSVYSIAKWT